MRHFVLAALVMTAALTPAGAAAQVTVGIAAERSPELGRLFADWDEARLQRNPRVALNRGDLRFADRFGDYVSDDYYAAERAAAETSLKALERIDPKGLSPHDQVSYDVFRWTLQNRLASLSPPIAVATIVRPIEHMDGLHLLFAETSSGEGVAPFKTVADYENSLKRMDGFAVYLDRAIARFREGMRTKVTQPRLVVDNVVEQFDTLLAGGVEGSIFMAPTRQFPDTVPEADRARLRAAYAETIGKKLNPAMARIRDFLRDEYRPAARAEVGLSAMPGGREVYAYLVRSQTTTDLAPAIHALGLREVARIRSEMEAVKKQVGFTGSLSQFFEHIRTDPRFKPKSKEELAERYFAVGRKVDAALPRLFSLMPKCPLDIRPTPAFREKSSAGGEYVEGTPDCSRPGVFYFNTYDLANRTTVNVETIYAHEGEPGHHFQVMLAVENQSLPAFQRFGFNPAFEEGWALYAESLGDEMGLFTDPYQRQGHLDDEMLRAMRLVVDTGLHVKGWSRDRAIQYMLDNSGMPKVDAVAEVERYIAIPGNALAYKVGQLKIRELRTRAEKMLGPRFDIRAFHAAVLEDGALPLTVLEAKIDRWIAARRMIG